MTSDRRPTIIVHSVADARVALAAAARHGIAVQLRSGPGAAAYLGAVGFLAIVAAAREDVPHADAETVLDCGDDAALAISALHEGVGIVRLHAAPETRARVADIARQLGGHVDETEDVETLDLLDRPDPAEDCEKWLARPMNPC